MRGFILFWACVFPLCLTAEPQKFHRKKELPSPAAAEKLLKNSAEGTSPSRSKKEVPDNRPAQKGQASSLPAQPETPENSAPCEGGIPIETFVQISASHSPQAGKNGVYFISDLRETPQVFFLKAPGQWPEQISFFPDGVPYFEVSPDGEKILLAGHIGGDEQYDIYLLETTKGSQVKPLLVDRAVRIESVAWGPNSLWFAFISNARNRVDFDLYRYDLVKGQSELLVELSGSNQVSDISPDGNSIAVNQFRSVTDSDVLVFDIKTKTLTNLTKGQGQMACENGKFSADSKTLFFISDKEHGRRQLFSLTLSSPRSFKPLTSENGEVEALSLNPTRTLMGYLVNEEGYSRLSGFEIDSSGRKTRLLSVPTWEKSLLRLPSFRLSPKSKGFFFTHSSSKATADIWQWENNRLTQWTRSTQALIPQQCFVEETLIRYPSFDGKEIPAFLYRPRNVDGPVPFIVYVHGGPESQYRPSFSKTFQYFLQRGFGILATNIRGSTGYGREFTLLDNYKLRMDSVKDVVEGAKWLIRKGQTKTGQLAIYGGSYGGFLVLRSIEIEPELFAAASESVGIANFVTFLKNTKPYRRALREVEYGPLSDEEFLRSVSPLTYVDQIKTPLLVFHGANDPRVPVGEAEQIIVALQKRDVPVESKIFLDEGHGNTKLRNILEQARLMALFFETHMKPNEPKK